MQFCIQWLQHHVASIKRNATGKSTGFHSDKSIGDWDTDSAYQPPKSFVDQVPGK